MLNFSTLFNTIISKIFKHNSHKPNPVVTCPPLPLPTLLSRYAYRLRNGKYSRNTEKSPEPATVDYYTSLFILCQRPSYGQLHRKLENSLEMNREEKLQRRRELRRERETPEQREERLQRERENARRRCRRLTEQQRQEILQQRRINRYATSYVYCFCF